MAQRYFLDTIGLIQKGLRHETEVYTMPVMAKKKTNHNPSPDDNSAPGEAESINILLRGLDPSLVEALDQHAKRNRRSRNVSIILLLEEAMQKQGLWKPSPDVDNS
jgi:hypothetical protein